jgi:hypothetical protein
MTASRSLTSTTLLPAMSPDSLRHLRASQASALLAVGPLKLPC